MSRPHDVGLKLQTKNKKIFYTNSFIKIAPQGTYLVIFGLFQRTAIGFHLFPLLFSRKLYSTPSKMFRHHGDF